MNLKEAFKLNKEIEQFIKNKKASGNPYTEDEVSYVNQYTGFGGMWSLDSNLEADRGLYEYYTPFAVIEKMVSLAERAGYRHGGKVLEPSCGVGRFLHYFPESTEVVGCEPDEISCEIARANFQSYDIRQQTFNELFIDRAGNSLTIKPEYQLIIGNPPYGQFKGRFTAAEKKATGAKTYPEYFLRRGANLLLPGGIIAYIIPSAWMDSEIEIPRLDLIEAYRMPISTFGGQTDISTDIVIYQKQ